MDTGNLWLHFFALIPYVVLSVPLVVLAFFLSLAVKKSGERVLEMLTPATLPQVSIPIVPKVKILRRMIDLKNGKAIEESIEATPDQIRSIFKKS